MKKLILAVLGLTIALPSMAMAESCEEFGVSCKKGYNVKSVSCSVVGDGYYRCDYTCNSKIDVDAFKVNSEKSQVHPGANDGKTSNIFGVSSNKSEVTSVTGSCGVATSAKQSSSAKKSSELKSLKAIDGPCGNEYLTNQKVDGVGGYIVHRYYVKSNNKFSADNFTNDYYCTNQGKYLKIEYDGAKKIWYATKNNKGKPVCVDDYDVTAEPMQRFCTQAYKKGEEPKLSDAGNDLYQVAFDENFVDTENTCENNADAEPFWFWIADNMPEMFKTEAEELKKTHQEKCEKLKGKIDEISAEGMPGVFGTKYTCKCPNAQSQAISTQGDLNGGQGGGSDDAKKKVEEDYEALKDFADKTKANKWRNKDGEFNTARLASDMTAGVVLGTAGALITSSLVKKSQVESGFEDIKCHISGQAVAEFGDEFTVGIK